MQVVKRMIERDGVDVNKRATDGSVPLCTAAFLGICRHCESSSAKQVKPIFAKYGWSWPEHPIDYPIVHCFLYPLIT